MRDIKFRGKSAINGEWVYGYYRLINKDKNVIYTINNGEIPIIADTQNQYTGLHDKNGKEIYEDDIVEYLGAKEDGFPELIINQVIWDECRWKLSRYSAEYYDWNKMNIIGNIYENKELLNDT